MDFEFTTNSVTGEKEFSYSAGSPVMLTGVELAKRKINNRLSMLLGEWAFNQELGLPLLDEVFRRPKFRQIAIGMIKKQILEVDGIQEVIKVEYLGRVDEREEFLYEARYQDQIITNA